jgi:hypothetical protein
MLRKKIESKLGKILTEYLNGRYADTNVLFTKLQKDLNGLDMSEKDMSQMAKFMSIFFAPNLWIYIPSVAS